MEGKGHQEERRERKLKSVCKINEKKSYIKKEHQKKKHSSRFSIRCTASPPPPTSLLSTSFLLAFCSESLFDAFLCCLCPFLATVKIHQAELEKTLIELTAPEV